MLALVIPEIVCTLTAEEITKFVGKTIIGQTVGWLTNRAFNNTFGLKEVRLPTKFIQNLEEIHNGMKKTEKSFHMLAVEMKWEQLDSRIFLAETNICHKFLLLKSIMAIKVDKDRTDAIDLLRTGILDINNGVLSDMYVIHKALLGKTVTCPSEKGLLLMWMEGVYKNMIQHPESAEKYYEHAMDYFNKAVILQFQGFILFWGACSSSQFSFQQLKTLLDNLSTQKKLVDELMSAAQKHLPNPSKGNSIQIIV